MKYCALLPLVIIAGTFLISSVSTAQAPVPYFDQRLRIAPLSRNEMAYLKRLVAEEDDGSLEATTASVDAAPDAWDNSCVSEPVNVGGFSKEESVDETPSDE